MTIVTTESETVRSGLAAPGGSWQAVMRRAVRDPHELCRLVGLPAELAAEAAAGGRDFPLFAPRGYIARMRPGDPDDPLLRQVLPRGAELVPRAGESTDPLGEREASLTPGLLQKYAGRVLLVTTGACGVHCRYCFRRHFPYGEAPRSPAAWQEAIDQIAADDSLREVILSGGDPLTLVDEHLALLTRRLAAIPHVKRLRIHTRLPIMIPERMTDALLGWLTSTRLTPIMVIHANHPAELDEAVGGALARLLAAGVVLLNQAVLLRRVNDDVPALVGLSDRLVELRVMPYYLHQFDRVAGAGHFEVPVREGRRLMAALRARLPGYAVPRYVQEIPGEPNKIVLA